MVIAVPSFYTREHLGLILGITQELGIPVKGFIPQAVAAVPERLPEGLLLHPGVTRCTRPLPNRNYMIACPGFWNSSAGIQTFILK